MSGAETAGDALPPVDVVIVGLGAAGGIAAHVLTTAGAEVVALEAGGRVGARDSLLDEIANDVHARLSRPKSAGEAPTLRLDPSSRAARSSWPTLMVNAVGGSTTHYPGLSARLPPWSFESRTRAVERYGPGAVPDGSTMADWPLTYDELEPYYELVERAIGVSGQAGNLAGGIQPGGNPFEGGRSGPYPLPALRRSGWTELTAAAARRLGWHPYPAPAAINSRPYNGNPECSYCGFCTGNVCHRDAKGSTDANVIRLAEATGLLRLETYARALRVEVDADGLASGVTYLQDGRERFQPARVVILGAFTYENTRLLLLSTSPAHPSGLGNGHGQVGRHYIAHLTPFALGRFPGRRLNLWSGLWAQATCVDDWNADNFDHAGLGFVGGGMLTAAQEAKPIASALAPLPPGGPRWGSAWKAWLHENARSVGVLNAQFDTLPYEENRLDLDPETRDPLGLPVVRATFRPRENEERGCAFLLGKMHEWLREAGADVTWNTPEIVVEGRHCYGGTRMGDDPETSVVDRHGLAHEVPNLGVIGASTFVSAGGLNPTLTVQALAWRTAEHVVDRRSSRGGSG